MAGHAADAHDACFRALLLAVAGGAADAHDGFGGAFGSGW